ncbi:MAG TPA: non-homologous end-joining DNA ligase [Candidatus Limnocylindria bacterium]|nr:non-homologous end-joining DNA ligase [Candidatus Limnocylindria bacterium]
MPLETYRAKRHFARTPEPAGAEPRPGGDRFVVHKHRATALHYDLRLEVDGVLPSWAVPKGPSLDPDVKRLAMRTEDHPIEYLPFEGVIPRGEYGAGDVIVWDWGHWEPEETTHPARDLALGELKFRLHGEKLAGRFTLVRTDGRGGGDPDRESWLLIHKRDEFAVAGWDAADHPRSVKTGRTNDEVASGAPPRFEAEPPAPGGPRRATDLAGAREAPLPEFVPPMRATAVDEAFDDDDWLFEIKWDGYRVEAVVADGQVRLWTRNKQDAGVYFPTLLGPPTWIAAREAVVDGEVVALDKAGRPDFSLLQDLTGIRNLGELRTDGRSGKSREERAAIPLVYQVFDLLHHDGRSLLDVPLEERKRLLKRVVRPHPRVRYGSHVEREGCAFVRAAGEQGLEGVLAKLRTSRYEPGRRSRSWLKIKLRREQELVVAGWLPGKGSHRELGSLIVGVWEDGKLRHAGQVGSGIDTRTRRELRERLDALARRRSALDPAPRLKEARWVEPEIVIRAEFSDWTTDLLLRQAAFKGVDHGRDPREVRREEEESTARAVTSAERAAARRATAGSTPSGADASEARAEGAPRATGAPQRTRAPQPRRARPLTPARDSNTAVPSADPNPPEASGAPIVASDDELRALDEIEKEGRWSIGGHEVRVSNLGKVLFPGRGDGPPADREPLTKRDLIRHYVSVAPVLVPYLSDRGLNLHRYPDGIGSGHGFWQKDVPGHAPAWIRRWQYTGHEGTKDYVVADRVATLAWLAQEAAVEIHPWTSPTEAPHRPSYALVDIDPGERTSWEEVLVLARLFRTALEHLGVRGIPKVTGQRGVQVWIPVRPIYGFDDTRDWVEGLSRAVGQLVPDMVSWIWEKRSRGGLARLDYTQNAVNKTLVAPYSVRPKPGAPVSVPIRWEELDDPDLRPDRWTIRSVPARLAEVGDLFAPALEIDQELPAL